MACDPGFTAAPNGLSCEGGWFAVVTRIYDGDHFHSHLFQRCMTYYTMSLLAVADDAWLFWHVHCGLEALHSDDKNLGKLGVRPADLQLVWMFYNDDVCMCVSMQMWTNVRTQACVWEVSAPTPSAPIVATAPLVWSWWMGRPAEVCTLAYALLVIW